MWTKFGGNDEMVHKLSMTADHVITWKYHIANLEDYNHQTWLEYLLESYGTISTYHAT